MEDSNKVVLSDKLLAAAKKHALDMGVMSDQEFLQWFELAKKTYDSLTPEERIQYSLGFADIKLTPREVGYLDVNAFFEESKKQKIDLGSGPRYGASGLPGILLKYENGEVTIGRFIDNALVELTPSECVMFSKTIKNGLSEDDLAKIPAVKVLDNIVRKLQEKI